MSPSSPLNDALRALEGYFLKDADVISATLTRRVNPGRFEGALVIMDQDDDGKPTLTQPIPWTREGFHAPSPAAEVLKTVREALDRAAQAPREADALAARFPEDQPTIVGVEDVRRWLAEAEPSPSPRPRTRPR